LANGVRVSRHRLDVSDHQAVAAFPKAVMAEHAGVDILVNNASIAISGTFDEASEDNFEWLFEINFWGVVRTCAFLPRLKASDDGQRAYSASKLRKNNGAASVRSNKTRRPGDRSRDLVH
jgi:NAD(P)-dependent dehydrogenase (short-subunit alcohol dehydrogenase family)